MHTRCVTIASTLQTTSFSQLCSKILQVTLPALWWAKGEALGRVSVQQHNYYITAQLLNADIRLKKLKINSTTSLQVRVPGVNTETNSFLVVVSYTKLFFCLECYLRVHKLTYFMLSYLANFYLSYVFFANFSQIIQ